KAGPERQKDELQVEIAMTPRTRDEERRGERADEADCGRGSRHGKRPYQNRHIKGVDQALIALDGPGLLDTAIDASGQKTVCDDDRDWSRKQAGRPDPRGKEKVAPKHVIANVAPAVLPPVHRIQEVLPAARPPALQGLLLRLYRCNYRHVVDIFCRAA